MRWLRRALRGWLLRYDARHPSAPTEIPPSLACFAEGELLPWKGVRLRVVKIVGTPVPCLILVPAGPTHGRKLQVMRNYRDAGRVELAQTKATEAALKKATR